MTREGRASVFNVGRFDSSLILNAASATEAELLVYGQIGASFWDDESVTAKSVVDQLAALPKSTKNITVKINSFGGSLADGLAIYNALKSAKQTVRCVVDGVAMSAASLIAMAGDTVEMPATSIMMIHAPSSSCYGNAAEMRKAAAVLDKFADAMVSAYTSKSGKSEADIKALLDGEDHFYTGAEAVAAGFADAIIGDAPTASYSANANPAWSAAVMATFKAGHTPPRPEVPKVTTATAPEAVKPEIPADVQAQLAALTASAAEAKAALEAIQAANASALNAAKVEADGLRAALAAEVEAKEVRDAVAHAVSAYGNLPVTAEEVGTATRALRRAAPEAAAKIEALLVKCNSAMAQLTEAKGSAAASPSGSVRAQVDGLIKALREGNSALTAEKAEGLVFAANPNLYAAIRAEQV